MNSKQTVVNNEIFPSPLDLTQNLIQKSQIPLDDFKKDYPYYRNFGPNIYEALSYIFLEEIFSEMNEANIEFMFHAIQLVRNDLSDFENEGNFFFFVEKQINPDNLRKIKKGYENLLKILEENCDNVLRIFQDQSLKNKEKLYLRIVYEFYKKLKDDCYIQMAIPFIIRSFIYNNIPQNTLNNEKLLNNYKFYKLQDCKGSHEDFLIIKKYSDIMKLKIWRYENGKIEKTDYSSGGKIYYVLILQHSIYFYRFYKNNQDINLEKQIYQNPMQLHINQSQNENVKLDETSGVKEDSKKKIDLICSICSISSSKMLARFYGPKCGHLICFDCAVKNYLQKENTYTCKVLQCKKKMKMDSIEEYINQVKIEETQFESSQIMPNSNNNLDNKNSSDNKNENKIVIDKNQNSENNELSKQKMICDKCLKSIDNEYFINQICTSKHIFCFSCIHDLVDSKNYMSTIFSCPNEFCSNSIDLLKANNFLMQHHEKNIKEDDYEHNPIKVSQKCYICDYKNMLRIPYKSCLEYYVCINCQNISCLIHNLPLEKCYCFCPKCLSKLTRHIFKPNIRFCVQCKINYCVFCHKDNCACMCNICNAHLEKGKCLNCESKYCCNCYCSMDEGGNEMILNGGDKVCYSCLWKNEKLLNISSRDNCLKNKF